MNITRFKSMFVLLALLLAGRNLAAQCNVTLSATVTNAGCLGASNGAIDLTVEGGTAPYTYQWSTGEQEEDISGLATGTYFVTVTDNLGCMANLARTVDGASAPLIIGFASGDINITCRDADQFYYTDLEVTASGGVGPYQYLWSDGSENNPLHTNVANTYTVTVTDDYGCSVTAQQVILSLLDFPIADAGPDQTLSCNNLQVTLGGNSSTGPNIRYLWVYGPPNWEMSTDQFNVVDEAWIYYRLEVLDTLSGCLSIDDVIVYADSTFPLVEIQSPPNLSCLVTQVSLSGAGSSTGPSFSHLWTTQDGHIVSGANTLNPVIDKPGTYRLSVTNVLGNCTRYKEVKVEDLPVADAGPDAGFPCAGAPWIYLDSEGPLSSQYTWKWSTSDGQIVGCNTCHWVNAGQPGTYTLLVTDVSTGCTKTDEVRVYPGPVLPAQDFTVLDVSCTGQLGIAGVDMTQGTAPYTYQWSNGETTAAIINVNIGTYYVSVTDATGCVYYGAVEVKNTPTLSLQAQTTNPACQSNSGTIDLTVTGVFGPFDYVWSNGAATEDLGNLPAGAYTVTVTYALGTCTETLSVALVSPSSLALSTVVTDFNACLGTSGSIDLTVSGGVAPYLYIWSDGETAQDAQPQGPGTYTVTVVDAAGCTQSISATILSVAGVSIVANVTNASCNSNNGSIDITVTGGTNLTYLWSNGATTADLTNLPAGTYTVTVTNAIICTETATVVVGENSTALLNANVTNDACAGNCVGAIFLSVANGLPPFTFLWNNGSTTKNLNNLCIGTYVVTVTDAGGCTATLSASVGLESAAVLTYSVTDLACMGPCDGAIDLTVTGGNAPYSYSWSNSGTTEDLNSLCSGFYDVTVTDAQGCTKTTFVSVGQTSAAVLSIVVTDSDCLGGCTGEIDLTVTGGVPPYQYFWSTGNATQDMASVCPGTYTVTVMDAAGCTKTIVAVVGTGSNLALSGVVTATGCFGSCDGAIDLSVSGGTQPYTYNWADGHTTQDLTNVCAGNITVTVTDATGCTKSINFNVSQNTTLDASVVPAPVSCFGLNDGSVDLTVTGGAPPYTYLWSNNATTEDVNGLTAGTYTVTVTDNNLCTRTAIGTIVQPSNINLSTLVGPIACFNSQNGAIDLTVTGGTADYMYAWSNTATTQDLNGLTANVYTVTVTDQAGCTKTTSVVLTEPTALVVTALPVPTSCFGANDGAVQLTVTGGVVAYSFVWSNSTTGQNLADAAAGTYIVTVTDANGCTKEANATVIEPAALTFDIVSLSNNCSSETITGPNLPGLSYQWSGPGNFNSTTPSVTVSVSGQYFLTITDAGGCSATNSYDVNISLASACGAVKGRVFHDEDESCSLNFGEPGLAGWLVRAEGVNDTLYGTTDAQGKFLIGVPLGAYAMKVLIPNGLWEACPPGPTIVVGMPGDTTSAGDFPVKSVYYCPALNVSIGTGQLRRCFLDNYYKVEYCNLGTETAQDAYVTVILDPYLTAISASIPYTDAGSNVLHFEVGDLEIGECGMFAIQVYVNCNAVIGQTHCTTASIYPDTLCAPTNANWSGASLGLSSVCSTDSLRFIIRNNGLGTMSNSSNYIVVEDGVMFRTGSLPPLAANESMEIAVEANGSTWRVEVGQEAYHPYPLPVGLSVEGCATTAAFSTGFVNQFTTPDEPPTIDIDCTTNISSFDPNDKHGYPVGYGADRYIRPGTDIEYLIRFQNTGTDTAFNVRIVDTLSSWLDPATIRFGASSHPYQYVLDGEGVVHFNFENILLPDSNTNEVASHGFAKFVIKPRIDAPLESKIENTAAIYFDFNDPVYTNTTVHRLGLNFVMVGLWQPEKPEAQVSAVPNPFSEETLLQVKGLERSDRLRLQVFDLLGNRVRDMGSDNGFFQLRKGDWPAGVYLFKISQNGRLVGSGKLVAE